MRRFFEILSNALNFSPLFDNPSRKEKREIKPFSIKSDYSVSDKEVLECDWGRINKDFRKIFNQRGG